MLSLFCFCLRSRVCSQSDLNTMGNVISRPNAISAGVESSVACVVYLLVHAIDERNHVQESVSLNFFYLVQMFVAHRLM